MSDVLNRTTKEFLRSVNDPDYPTADWIIEPMVGAQRMRDWIDPSQRRTSTYVDIAGDVVTEMSDVDKDAVDAAAAAAADLARKAAAKDEYDGDFELLIKALALVMIDEVNILRAVAALPDRTAAQLRTAIRNKVDSL